LLGRAIFVVSAVLAAWFAAGPALALDPAESDVVTVDRAFTREQLETAPVAAYDVACPVDFRSASVGVAFEYPAALPIAAYDGRQDVVGELSSDEVTANFVVERPFAGQWVKLTMRVVCIRANVTVPPPGIIESAVTALPGETFVEESAQCPTDNVVLGGSVVFPDGNGMVLQESANVGPFDPFGLPPIIGPPSLWQGSGVCAAPGCEMRIKALCAALPIVDLYSGDTVVVQPGQTWAVNVSCPPGTRSTAGSFVSSDPTQITLLDLVPTANGVPIGSRLEGTYGAPNGWQAIAINSGTFDTAIGANAVCVAASEVVVPPSYQGLWWADPPGSESGWGINFAHQGDIIFATWFTYDAAGKPTWYAAELHMAAEDVYSGNVITVSGVPYDSPVWDTSKVVETTVGTMTVAFSDPTHGLLDYTVNGVSQTKAIVPQAFASPVPACVWGLQSNLALATNYQDLWWAVPAGAESGWGVNFTQQGDIIFFTWFTYDAAGKPTWFIAVASKTGEGVFSGPISTVVGNPFNAVPWDPAKQVETEVGSTTITFADGNRASFSYTINGVTQTKQITRQVFAGSGTYCQ
jgi:hypothetical protein